MASAIKSKNDTIIDRIFLFVVVLKYELDAFRYRVIKAPVVTMKIIESNSTGADETEAAISLGVLKYGRMAEFIL
jgi:hypothetical protein